MTVEAKCCNCGGEHVPEFLKCPVRVKETEVTRIRVVQHVSYPEGVRRVEEGSKVEETMVVGLETSVNVTRQ